MDRRTHDNHALFLPGVILPAADAYAALLDALGSNVDARTIDLAVYETPDPPADYSLATEVAGIARFADESGWERFHLAGYSAGGAASLAFAARYPDRLWSLAIIEPAFAGWWAMTPDERRVWEDFRVLLDAGGPDLLARFVALQLAPGVRPAPPPPGQPPAWMAQRPAGIRAVLGAFFATDLDRDALHQFTGPVWCALGGRSNPDYFALAARRLAAVFPDFSVAVFPDRHHLDPPHRTEPARVAEALRALWERARR